MNFEQCTDVPHDVIAGLRVADDQRRIQFPKRHSSQIWIVALALVLALAFLGSRGIWDPDEGRYTNVAVNMLSSGDWLNPHRNADVSHWTKPPLTYWAIASSVGVFGLQSWAARFPMALSYLLCVWLAYRMAKRLTPGAETTAAVSYATMLLPFGSSQLVTTDAILAACETLAVWGFVEARFSPDSRRSMAWIAVMWAGLALAFLTKGPPGLLPLLVVLVFDRLIPGRTQHRVLQLPGIVLFTLLAAPWYAAVVHGNPGLLEYFIGDEVINRVATDEFRRHGEWYGWIVVYVPTLLLGTLPWTFTLLRWTRTLPSSVRRWREPEIRRADAPALLLALWVALPLLVFCLSRSRLHLYILPLFAPLALLVATQRRREGRTLPPWPWLATWAAMLLSLKLAAAHWPTHKDASDWAEAIRLRMPAPVHEVVFVDDMARYGLRLHLDAEVEKVSLTPIRPGTQPRFNPSFDEDLAVELAEAETASGAALVCRQSEWPRVRAYIEAQGFRSIPLGDAYQGRVIFRIEANRRGRAPRPAPHPTPTSPA
jgi:4-amino-4-deoxy-L-arabinose transferase-like glycosyltransferase